MSMFIIKYSISKFADGLRSSRSSSPLGATDAVFGLVLATLPTPHHRIALAPVPFGTTSHVRSAGRDGGGRGASDSSPKRWAHMSDLVATGIE